MAKQTHGYITAKKLLGRGEDWQALGQVKEISINDTLVFTGSTLGVNPDVLGSNNLDGGSATSTYGGTTAIDCGGA